MTKFRKPIPKTQKQISKGLQDAFDTTRGNPNQTVNPNESQTGIDFNRGHKLSMKNDSSKLLTIGIQDLDEAVFYYFDNVIKPFVYQNGQRRSVPFIYAAPERWKSYQRDGYYRDKGGAIMLPIIVVKRNNIEKDRSVYNKLDANGVNLYSSFQKKYSPNNFYNNFSVLNNKKAVNISVLQHDILQLEQKLQAILDDKFQEIQSAGFSCNERQKSILQKTHSILQKINYTENPELISEEFRHALHSISYLIGNIDTEEILGEVFSSFCIGK